jgi:hypothetical protein
VRTLTQALTLTSIATAVRSGLAGALDGLSVRATSALSAARLLYGTYSGNPLIRARRSSDNAEANIPHGLIIGDLDTGALLSHVYTAQTAFLGGATGYSSDGATVSVGTPTGWNTITENAASSFHRGVKAATGTFTAGTQYRLAWIARRTGPTARNLTPLLTGANGTQSSVQYAFDLATGGTSPQFIVNATSHSASAVPITYQGQAAWLCTMTFVPSVNSTMTLYFELATTANTRIYQGDGASGAQFTTPAVFLPATDLNAFITTAYDQSGNGLHATQPTASRQWQIVSAGAVTREPITGKIAPLTNTSSAACMFTSVPMREPCAISVVSSRLAGGVYWGNDANRGAEGQFNTSAGQFRFLFDGSVRSWSATNGQASTSALQTGLWYLNGNNTATYWDNGTNLGPITKGATVTAGNFLLGNFFNGFTPSLGWMPEIVIFGSAPSAADAAMLQANQKAYYGTP